MLCRCGSSTFLDGGGPLLCNKLLEVTSAQPLVLVFAQVEFEGVLLDLVDLARGDGVANINRPCLCAWRRRDAGPNVFDQARPWMVTISDFATNYLGKQGLLVRCFRR